ncbi:MAG: MBL fold metallo-hydrolase, partial [Lachnospiraceae bacterium]|nr:MBL fold metallo-hydrolase [Lachnospiraceae bacterium]
MLNVKELPIHKQFSRRLIKPDTWLINSYDPSCESPNPYVLIGDTDALVIDTTDTKQNVRAYIETCITDKPLSVASTHSHHDHTLNNGLFNERPIYMSQVAWEEIQENRKTGFNGKAADYVIGDYVPIIVKPGDIIDLGGRQSEVIEFGGCHSRSSIAYLDKKYGILFS